MGAVAQGQSICLEKRGRKRQREEEEQKEEREKRERQGGRKAEREMRRLKRERSWVKGLHMDKKVYKQINKERHKFLDKVACGWQKS